MKKGKQRFLSKGGKVQTLSRAPEKRKGEKNLIKYLSHGPGRKLKGNLAGPVGSSHGLVAGSPAWDRRSRRTTELAHLERC